MTNEDLTPKEAALTDGLTDLIAELEYIRDELVDVECGEDEVQEQLENQTGTLRTLLDAWIEPKRWRGMPLATKLKAHNGLEYALEIPLDDQDNPRVNVIRVVEYRSEDEKLLINDVQGFPADLSLPFLRELSHCFDNFVSAWEKN